MPTFKPSFTAYDVKKGEKENLLTLMEQYNEMVHNLSYTLNHLDEENLSESLLNNISQQEGDAHG